ncbi:MAG TPA: GNAT family N-acetyltransferase [Candidatus Elarobacter sp.]|jgi:predicted acetyltransferase
MTTATRGVEIRPLEATGERPELFAQLARLLADAYPIMRRTTVEALDETARALADSITQPGLLWVVAERDGDLAGVMRLYDYEMNVRGRDALTGGVGSVGVALAHKRRGIARALIGWYLDHYRERGAPFAVLHAFRLDFYRALGFGYGTPMHRYRFAPATLRDDGARGTIRILGPDDAAALMECDERVRPSVNGLIRRHRSAVDRALNDAALRHVAVEEHGVVRAFMQTFAVPAADDMLRNRDELVVRELTYEDYAYRAALLGYLRSQQDQFTRVAIESQDDALYLASSDPRDGSDESVAPPAAHRIARTGLGVMYRIVDLERAFAHLPPSGMPFTLRLEVEDATFAETRGAWTFRFGPQAAPQLDDTAASTTRSDGTSTAAADATLTIGIADLSSVVMGSLRLRDAVRNRLANVEPRAKLELVDAAFRAEQRPYCTTRF